MIRLTLFESIYDTITNKSLEYQDFSEFEAVLYKLAEKDKYKKKSEAPLISPAVYAEGTTRANDNVLYWGGFAILDIDDYEGTIQEISKKYSSYYYVCYSTASSTEDHPKFRLVFPLSTDVDKSKIKAFWHALNVEIGDIADAQTKDLSRMFYIPSLYENANNFIFTHDGDIINPEALIAKHPYVEPPESFLDKLPEEMQKRLIQHKLKRMTNTTYSWTDYSDCPFLHKKLITEYQNITGTGWYKKMYDIMLSVAGNAFNKGYPITAHEITYICKTLDRDNGNWYGKRKFSKEADRAIQYVLRNL